MNNAKKFLHLMDEIENLIDQAEKIGWNEVRNGNEELGWAMQGIAQHMNWWIYNSPEYAESWVYIEKEGE